MAFTTDDQYTYEQLMHATHTEHQHVMVETLQQIRPDVIDDSFRDQLDDALAAIGHVMDGLVLRSYYGRLMDLADRIEDAR